MFLMKIKPENTIFSLEENRQAVFALLLCIEWKWYFIKTSSVLRNTQKIKQIQSQLFSGKYKESSPTIVYLGKTKKKVLQTQFCFFIFYNAL